MKLLASYVVTYELFKGHMKWKTDIGLSCSLVTEMGMCDLVTFCFVWLLEQFK